MTTVHAHRFVRPKCFVIIVLEGIIVSSIYLIVAGFEFISGVYQYSVEVELNHSSFRISDLPDEVQSYANNYTMIL